jgi:hypothetical protein
MTLHSIEDIMMTNVTVYDSPLCCATGVCGPSVDPKLAQFAGDLEWLKNNGVTVTRYNLAQEPGRFVENSIVKDVLERSGEDELPVILVGEELASFGRVPDRAELSKMTGLEIDASTVDTKSASTGCGEGNTGCC